MLDRKWLGNTSHVARKHDLTVTDEDYQKAVQNWGLTGDKLWTQPPAEPRTGAHEKTRVAQNIGKNASFSEVVDILENARVAGTGFELPRENPVKTGIPNHGGAECGALSAQHLKLDPQLQTLILAWPDLPATLKAGILAMVESCTDR